MVLLLNNVLNLTQEEIDNSKIEFNMQAGSGGQPFLDRWLKHSEAEKMSGTCADCSYWGWYGKQRNFYPGQWVFSFARMTDDEWLLISAAEIVDVPVDEWATANVLERFVPLFGRLIIKCKKGNTFSRYVFNLKLTTTDYYTWSQTAVFCHFCYSFRKTVILEETQKSA